MRRPLRPSSIAVLAGLLVLPVLVLVFSQHPAATSAAEPQAPSPQAIAGTAVVAAPDIYVPVTTAEPVEPTLDQREAKEAFERMSDSVWAKRRLPVSPEPVVAPAPGTETSVGRAARNLETDGADPALPGTFTLFKTKILKPNVNFSSDVNEPAIGQSGKNIFYTGNWYAARSTTGGALFTYISPYADFPAFCCDQDVIYDRGRDMMMWYRQGVIPSGQTQNQFKLGVSSNGGVSWCTYTISPINVNSEFTSRWFDYPHLALTNNFLYMTTNLFTTAGAFDRMLVLRWPLDSLKACAGFSYSYNSYTAGWSWTPAIGGTTTAYLGDHYDTANMIVWSWPESGSMTGVIRAVPAWTFTNRDGHCPDPSGRNPCLRADQRITSGWIRGNELGFFWNVRESAAAGFAYPYINAATFDLTTLAYVGRPLIFNGSYAFHWGAAAPNVRGDLGIGLWAFYSSAYAQHIVGIDDDYNGAPPGWEIVGVIQGNAGPSQDKWGDYGRVRYFAPQGTTWVATGFIRNKPRIGPVRSQPHYVIFGRERDAAGSARFQLK